MDDIIWPDVLMVYVTNWSRTRCTPDPPPDPLFTIDQREFCTPALFEFNA